MALDLIAWNEDKNTTVMRAVNPDGWEFVWCDRAAKQHQANIDHARHTATYTYNQRKGTIGTLDVDMRTGIQTYYMAQGPKAAAKLRAAWDKQEAEHKAWADRRNLKAGPVKVKSSPHTFKCPNCGIIQDLEEKGSMGICLICLDTLPVIQCAVRAIDIPHEVTIYETTIGFIMGRIHRILRTVNGQLTCRYKGRRYPLKENNKGYFIEVAA